MSWGLQRRTHIHVVSVRGKAFEVTIRNELMFAYPPKLRTNIPRIKGELLIRLTTRPPLLFAANGLNAA